MTADSQNVLEKEEIFPMTTLHASDKPFTVAILADIQGNLAALGATLTDLATQSNHLVIAGDLDARCAIIREIK